MAAKRLYRSETDRMIAGICGGIAQMYEIDPSIVRLAAVFLAAITALLPMIIVYVVGWAIVPLGPTASRQEPPGRE
jgi:phage shock protein C